LHQHRPVKTVKTPQRLDILAAGSFPRQRRRRITRQEQQAEADE